MNTHYNYVFFKARPQLHKLSPEKRQMAIDEFLALIEEEQDLRVYAYGTLGLKHNTTMMLWIQSSSIEQMQMLLQKLMHSELGYYLTITYTLFGIKRQSSYGSKGTAEMQEMTTTTRGKYLIIYPFTKTTAWYQLPFEERKVLMHEHIKTGYTYAHIKQHLLYAIGIDDHEFIVSYETESLEEFQNLVMDMRSTKVRIYTQNDLPIFTCVFMPLSQALQLL